jgi:hypothetical protein
MALSLETAQLFVNKLAADLAARVVQQSTVLPAITAQHQQEVVAPSAALTLNHTARNGSALSANADDFNSFSATLPIQRLLDDSRFYAETLQTLAQLQVDVLETAVLSFATNFIENTPLGAQGVAPTQAVIDSAINALLARSIPPGDPISLILSTRIGGGTNSPYRDVLALSEILNAEQVGDVARAVAVNYRPPRYRGMNIIRSANVRQTGVPTTQYNLALAKSALLLATCRNGLTNDSSNVQAYSESGVTGMRIALAFTGADNQTVTISSRGAAVLSRNSYAIQVRS